MGTWVTIFPGRKGHGSLYSWENGDPAPHITGRRVTRNPHYPRNTGIPWWKWGPPVWLTVFPGAWGPSVWQVILSQEYGDPLNGWPFLQVYGNPLYDRSSVNSLALTDLSIVCYRTVYNSEREVPTNALATHSHSHWCSNHRKGCDGFHLPFSEVLFSSLDFFMKDIATGYFPLPVGQVLYRQAEICTRGKVVQWPIFPMGSPIKWGPGVPIFTGIPKNFMTPDPPHEMSCEHISTRRLW